MADRPWEKEGWVTLSDEEHEIHGVTVEMIDWWWDNMEKGYVLWHPTEHKNFYWEVAPGDAGHVGAVQVADQDSNKQGGARGKWLDVSVFPFPIDYDHCLVLEGFNSDKDNQDLCVHMYSATDYGCKHRFLTIMRGPRAKQVKEMINRRKNSSETRSHPTVEAERWPEFLPELYRLWSVVRDPRINPHPNLKIKKMPNGRYSYTTPQNKPPKA